MVLSLSCLVNTANAGLITTDLLTSGDGLTTRDTSSNLEWLDVNQNIGSLAQAVNDWGSLGFRVATQADVLTLLNTLGMTNLSHTTHTFVSPTGAADALAAFAQFGTDSCTGCLNFAYDYQATDLHPFNSAELRLGRMNANTYNTHTLGHGFIPDSGDYYHALMVRNASQVPEPSTLAIFALGMIGLASRRFKKQS